MMRRSSRQWLWWLLLAEVLLVHGGLAVILLHPVLAYRIAAWFQPRIAPSAPAPYYFQTLHLQQGWDAQTGHPAVLLFGDSRIAEISPVNIAPDTLNFGIEGEQLEQTLRRLSTYTTVPRARVIVVGSGVNNVLRQAPLDLDAVAHELNQIPGDVAVIVAAILPLGTGAPLSPAELGSANIRIAEANERLQSMVRQRAQTAFLPIPSEWLDADGCLRDSVTRDGIHLTDEANREYARQIARSMETFVQP